MDTEGIEVGAREGQVKEGFRLRGEDLGDRDKEEGKGRELEMQNS